MKYRILLTALLAVTLSACEEVLLTPVEEEVSSREPVVLLEDVARVLSHVPLEGEQLDEVHDAAQSSATNGYDEEDFAAPAPAADGHFNLSHTPGLAMAVVASSPVGCDVESTTRPIHPALACRVFSPADCDRLSALAKK